MIAHGVDYVFWPRLVPSYKEALTYSGKGHESGRHGRAGVIKSETPSVSRVSIKTETWRRQSVQEVELGQKKRVD